MSTFKDHFSGHAPDYRAFRPEYPPALFEFLATLAPKEGVVWDCGTGNGQAAVVIAEHFHKVFATDASETQIREAKPHPRVEYTVARAESCPLPDRSVNLVTVAQALHWFSLDGFYREVRRVCVPGGCLVVWTYDLQCVDSDVDPVLRKLESEVIGPYWPPERALVNAGYRTIPFPFEEIPTPRLEMSVQWDLNRFTGYLNTWSSTKAFIRARGFSPVDHLGAEFAAAWGEPSIVRTVHWLLYLRAGRVG